MILKVLSENMSVSDNYKSEHGLSLFIETKKHKILFDTGAGGIFAENALKMGVDLAEVDIVVLSHGHYDHGGGLGSFLNLNQKAKIYVHKRAFEKHYSKRPGGEKKYIGLDAALLPNDRFVFTEDRLAIDKDLELFSAVRGIKFYPSGNQDLLMESAQSFVTDDFSHEQSLLLHENEKCILIAGCAHRGIVNILEHMRQVTGRFPSHVIGGFHLTNPAAKTDEDPAIVSEIGDYLLQTNAKYYTCHCTGLKSYATLKHMMAENVDYLPAGSQIIL